MSKRNWSNDEIKEYRKLRGFFFYYNKEDSNFLVPKSFGIGWTLNWANPFPGHSYHNCCDSSCA